MGCSSITSVFAFLVFLFALLDFLLGMNKRRRRDTSWQEAAGRGPSSLPPASCPTSWAHHSDPVVREATLAAALLLRGRLLESPGRCRDSRRCQQARGVQGLGRWGILGMCGMGYRYGVLSCGYRVE